MTSTGAPALNPHGLRPEPGSRGSHRPGHIHLAPPQPDHRPDMTWRRAATTGGTGSGRVTPSVGQTQSCKPSQPTPHSLSRPTAANTPDCVTLGHSLAISVQVSSSAQKKPAPCQACEAASGVRAALGPRPHRASCVAEPKTSPSVFPLGLYSAAAAEYVVIACLVQGFFPPEPVSVTWSPSNENATVRNFPPVKAEAGASYTMSSQLTLPANQCPDDSVLKCQVQHSSNTLPPVSVAAGPPPSLSDRPPGTVPEGCPSCDQPRLSLRQPALEDLLLGSNASLTCTLSGLKDPTGASFTWKPSGGKDAIQRSPEQDSCGCYSVTSVLPGCAEQWNRGDTFSCAATHPESKSSLTATIKKPTGNTFRPQVHLLPPPSEELALNELVSLTCLVRGFSPEDVLIRWLQGTQELPPEKYVTWKPLKEPGQSVPTFSVTSVLRVDAEAWKQGDKFSCMVGHEALSLSFTQKTIDRLAGKPTHVNVSVVMAEVDGVCY
uniref:Ig-like domain-containing protein n=1 Tax=Ursus americanus TaxID=9643 RepID=A0A452QNV9_URSAM